MSSLRIRTEDEVRDGYTSSTEWVKGAKQILEFDKPEKDVEQGTGQIKTFKQLGFNGDKNNHKPDGWYLPKDTTKTAIILETKAEDKDLSDEDFVNELLTNVKIVNVKYDKVVGILYNGKEQRIFLNEEEMIENIPAVLQPKSYYTELFNVEEIDSFEEDFIRKMTNYIIFKKQIDIMVLVILLYLLVK